MGLWSDIKESISPPQGQREPMTERYSVVVIEGCEYIQVYFLRGMDAGYYSLTHKGNCNNPIHRRKESK